MMTVSSVQMDPGSESEIRPRPVGDIPGSSLVRGRQHLRGMALFFLAYPNKKISEPTPGQH